MDVSAEFVAICSRCGIENDSTRSFCTKCQEPIPIGQFRRKPPKHNLEAVFQTFDRRVLEIILVIVVGLLLCSVVAYGIVKGAPYVSTWMAQRRAAAEEAASAEQARQEREAAEQENQEKKARATAALAEQARQEREAAERENQEKKAKAAAALAEQARQEHEAAERENQEKKAKAAAALAEQARQEREAAERDRHRFHVAITNQSGTFLRLTITSDGSTQSRSVSPDEVAEFHFDRRPTSLAYKATPAAGAKMSWSNTIDTNRNGNRYSGALVTNKNSFILRIVNNSDEPITAYTVAGKQWSTNLAPSKTAWNLGLFSKPDHGLSIRLDTPTRYWLFKELEYQTDSKGGYSYVELPVH